MKKNTKNASSNPVNTNNNIDNNTKEVSAMMNTNSNYETEIATTKKASYSKPVVKLIMADIEAGMTFTALSAKYGIKAQRTIKNWLDVTYPIKKAIVLRIWNKLKENNRNAKAEAEAFVIPMATPTPTVPFNDADFIESYEDWWGGDTPLVDVLIDSLSDKDTLSLAVSFCMGRGLTFRFSNREGSCINIQALAWGKPLVITSNSKCAKHCRLDDIEILPVSEIKVAPPVRDASTDIQYNPHCFFSCMSQGKNGVLSCKRTELCNEFKKQHSIHSCSGFDIYIGNRKATERMGLKDGHVLSFVVTEGRQTTVWKYELRGNIFYEIEYFSGGKELRKIFNA